MILATLLELYLLAHRLYKRFWLRDMTPSGRIRDLPFGLVLKISRLERSAPEADTLRFVRANTSIPVPRVFASAEGHRSRYLLMQRIDGQTLEHTWNSLHESRRAKIIDQLRSFVAQIRALPPPHGRAVCALDRAVLRDSRITSSGPVGPFADERAFNDYLIDVAEPFMDETKLPAIRARIRDDHDIVFTHGDLAPRNIIVRGDVIVALIDWEESGWYPEHWEFVKALYCPMMTKDGSWDRHVRDVFARDYEADWQMDRELSVHMIGGF